MTTKKRGFAAMSPDQQRQIAAMGGRAVPNEKRSFAKNRELAAAAGTKGGSAVPAEKRSFAMSTKLASKSGRKGGLAARRNRNKSAGEK
ncbi:MAG: KGG domain-containing protein [Beijerinckiaceae bacterium]